MLCSQCNGEFQTPAPYCSYCGGSLQLYPSEREPLNREAEAVFAIVPTLVGKLAVQRYLPINVFLVLWGTLFFGGLSYLLLRAMDVVVRLDLLLLGVGTVLLTFVPAAGLKLARGFCSRAHYTFYPHRLNFVEGTLRFRSRSLPYSDLRKVEFEQDKRQARHGLGTIVFSTRTSDTVHSRTLMLNDVPDPERATRRIRALIDACGSETSLLKQAA